MPIPDYQTLMLPLLRFASDDADHTTREAVDVLADQPYSLRLNRIEILWKQAKYFWHSFVGLKGKALLDEVESLMKSFGKHSQ